MSSGYLIDQDGKFTLVVDGEFTKVRMADGGTIGQAAGPLLTFDDTNNYLEITGCKVGINTDTPISALHLAGEGAYTDGIVVGSGTSGFYAENLNQIGFRVGDALRYRFLNTDFRSVNNYSFALRSAAGTAAWPTYNFLGDTDNGMFRAAANELGLSTTGTERVRIDANGNVGVGATPLAKCHIDQSVDDAAIPVLILDQADVSEEMIEFVSTIGVGNAIEAVGEKTLTTTHFIKVTLPGALTRYIPVGTIA